jgi:hypothetical protein
MGDDDCAHSRTQAWFVLSHRLRAHTLTQYVSKTDEPRIQSALCMLDVFKGKPWYSTLKIDGTSGTYLIDPESGKLVVCSRNLQRPDTQSTEPPRVKDGLTQPGDDVYWSCARKYKIEEILRQHPHLAIQGEIYGPNINDNRLQVKEQLFAVFNVFNIRTQHLFGFASLQKFCASVGLPMVPVLESGEAFNYTLDQLLEQVKGAYPDSTNPREGIVYRLQCTDDIPLGRFFCRPSFKLINDDYLLKFHL